MNQQFLEVYAPIESQAVLVGGVGAIEVVQPTVLEVIEAPARASVLEIITAGGQGPPGPPGPAGVTDAGDIEVSNLVAWFNLAAGL